VPRVSGEGEALPAATAFRTTSWAWFTRQSEDLNAVSQGRFSA
jgi:hypothetical protein